jgi:corrinoid protein of di/trimethylamine methyltransferase
MSLETLSKLVKEGEAEESEAMASKLLAEGTDPLQMIETLTETMNRLGDLFAKLEIFLPEIMLAGDAVAAVVKVLRPYLASAGGRELKGKVVLGVAKGDLHEIGKNIAKLILETNGFEIEDLGYDVDPLDFIKAAESMGADYIGISSLMTTTMPGQQEVIELLKEKGLRDKYKVVIGGAPTTQFWADKIGADLYCQHAKSAPVLMSDLLKRQQDTQTGKGGK